MYNEKLEQAYTKANYVNEKKRYKGMKIRPKRSTEERLAAVPGC